MPSAPSASMIAPAPSWSSTAKRSGAVRAGELARGDHGDARARAAPLLLGEHGRRDRRGVAQPAEQHERAGASRRLRRRAPR